MCRLCLRHQLITRFVLVTFSNKNGTKSENFTLLATKFGIHSFSKAREILDFEERAKMLHLRNVHNRLDHLIMNDDSPMHMCAA